MNFKLISKPDKRFPAILQVLLNRGIAPEDCQRYLHTTDADINKPFSLGKENLVAAAKTLIIHIKNNDNCLVIIDADADGFCSSAILINYLHDIFPAWVENKVKWFLHDGKQHGLKDSVEEAKNYKLVIVPDAGSNDYEEHKILKEQGTDIIILDHHEAPKISQDAITINNQLSDYPNKFLCGGGIVWQFCRYLDIVLNKNYAEKYRDLCALANISDMMSMTSIETKHLIMSGLEDIQNPFFSSLVSKNSYSIGDEVTPYGVAFYVTPYINAIVRSGTQAEKEIVFESFLTYKAFNQVPSTKRGHKLNETEMVVAQAMRIVANVKNRQTKAQEAGVALLENMIEKNHLLDHKVLLFLLEPGQIDSGIAGLIANKFMAKYQRPCCVLTKVYDDDLVNLPPWDNYWKTHSVDNFHWKGSARGYEKSGITNFKDICETAPYVEYATGHQNAFGLSIEDSEGEIKGETILQFLDYMDEKLKNVSSNPVYYIDYIYHEDRINAEDIISISHLKNLWGKDMEETLIGVKDLIIDSSNINVYNKKTNTIKITLRNGIVLMKFNASEEECNLFTEDGYDIHLDLVGTCNENQWNGETTPQIFIQDYEIIRTPKIKHIITAADF